MSRVAKWLLLTSFVVLIFTGCASDEEKKQSHMEKGNAYFEKADYKSAVIEYKNAIKIDPKYRPAYEGLAETNVKLGDLQGAFRAYAAVAELDPNNLDAQLKLANFFLLGRQFDDARGKVDLILGKDPNHVDALILLAMLLAQEQNLFESAATFEKAIGLDSQVVRAYLGLSRVLAAQGEAVRAEQTLKEATAGTI